MLERFDLDRFVRAQAPVMAQVRTELKAGRKSTHWMWFVFPQISGLGHSQWAQLYAIASLDEAKAYLAHQVLGHRLVECTGLVNAIEGRTAQEIFGSPDDIKFRSSMTLFSLAGPDKPAFGTALEKYFEGSMDQRTLELLGKAQDRAG
jgi:uncharacterized protein (DUF1810 family)